MYTEFVEDQLVRTDLIHSTYSVILVHKNKQGSLPEAIALPHHHTLQAKLQASTSSVHHAYVFMVFTVQSLM